MTKITAACVQMRSTIDMVENCAAMETLVRKAAGDGAGYIQTPEMTGLLQKNRRDLFSKISDQADDPVFKLAAKLSAELKIWLHIGSTAIRFSDEKAVNRAGLFSPVGECVATYDKIHMFDVDLDNGESWRESKVYQPGTCSQIVDTNNFKLGMSICYDVRFPHLYREMALNGAEILACPAAFTRQTGQAHWHTLLKARAIENGAFVVAAAQGGDHEDGRETFGHSLIVNPWGEIIAEIANDAPGYVMAELNLEEVKKARGKIPNLANARDFTLENATLKIGEVA